jgi:hypothetical protein
MSFLLEEDEALRNLLKDMVVTDQKSVTEDGPQRKVGVWFGQPDQEIRNQSYPYITIDMIDIAEAFDRAHRGRVNAAYYADPDTMTTGVNWDSDLHAKDMDYPIPVNLDYQITTYARQPRHDRQILAQLLYTKIPLRFAVLNVGPDTQFGTTRRLDVLDISKRDITEQGKRLFVNAITVRISSEIAPTTFNKLYKVQELNVTGTTGSQIIGRGEFTAVDPITITAP